MQQLTEIEKLQHEKRRQDCLPHLYGHKFYPWQRKFWNSVNRMNFLTAANQIGKSSIAIKKCIHWATHQRMWKDLWPLKINHPYAKPNMFWYLYPDKGVATQEYHEKWVPEFLPREEYKDDPQYGWKAEFDKKQITKIIFNSGVTIYFKTYKQDPQSLQSGTVYAIFCDEELPFELYDELKMRLSNTEGYYHNVFTATLNQEQWRLTMEVKGNKEKFPHAFKQQISLYDCMYYEDGSPSYWTKQRIKNRIDDCGSETEIKRRIFGKFVSEEGLKYDNYDPDKHVVDPTPVPKDWVFYSGVDIGSGGKTGHPSAIVFVAVDPKFTKGRVVYGWRGDGILTTSGDVVQKYIQMLEEYELENRMGGQFYDWHNKDFFTIAERVGLTFKPANKNHEVGEGVLNSLFKYEALLIEDKAELCGIGEELLSINRKIPKNKAVDDFVDGLRYAITSIPWNWEKIKPPKPKRKKVFDPVKDEMDRRRGLMVDPHNSEPADQIIEELNMWNDLYDI